MKTQESTVNTTMNMYAIWNDFQMIRHFNRAIESLPDQSHYVLLFKERISELTRLLVDIHQTTDIQELDRAMEGFMRKANLLADDICLANGIGKEILKELEENAGRAIKVLRTSS